tara:strand:+ start:648 stop:1373 length:726 start_codon:yes stop_codon:yes gene_type:complete
MEFIQENNQIREDKELINYNLNLNELRNEYNKLNIIQINNILEESFSEALFKQAFLEKNWVLSTGFDKNKFQKPTTKQFEKANALQIKNVNNHFKNDEFTYIFHRTMNNNKPNFLEFCIRKQLNSDKFIKMINDITKKNVTQLSTMFLSKYKSNNFLSPHSDKGNGKVAFVLNLSKFWKPQYGGILNFLDESRKNIIKSYVPDFNNLILFEVPENGYKPHFVSHVAPNIKHSRYAVTGWYD